MSRKNGNNFCDEIAMRSWSKQRIALRALAPPERIRHELDGESPFTNACRGARTLQYGRAGSRPSALSSSGRQTANLERVAQAIPVDEALEKRPQKRMTTDRRKLRHREKKLPFGKAREAPRTSRPTRVASAMPRPLKPIAAQVSGREVQMGNGPSSCRPSRTIPRPSGCRRSAGKRLRIFRSALAMFARPPMLKEGPSTLICNRPSSRSRTPA